MNQKFKALFVLLLVLLVSACAGERHRVHQSLSDDPEKSLPKSLLILPFDVVVNELTAGGVSEEVPAWSEQAKSNLVANLKEHISGKAVNFSVVDLPELSESEQETLDQHMALYDVVGSSGYMVTSTNEYAWKHKRENFDYSIGDGLKFLKQKTGADAGIVFTAVDFVPTDERKAMAVAAAILGVSIPMGNPFMFVGLVDFETGDILWLNFVMRSGFSDLREVKDVRYMMEDLFEKYPGVVDKKVAKK